MKTQILTVLTFLAIFSVTGILGLILIIFVAGPHSDLLPDLLRIPVGMLILTVVLGLPGLAAYQVFKKLDKNKIT